MASKKHQFLLGLLLKKARLSDYQIFFLEGRFLGSECTNPIPPRILRHRPDALGISVLGRVCICDAKTESDINNARTKEQLVDFTKVELNGLPCEVFIAIPSNAETKLNFVMKELGLLNYPHLQILRVPEEIING
jgi:hypothetical protein